LGCFSIVLECIPEDLSKQITDLLSIPTIGIGAGPHTSGQVLVLQDLLGSNPDFNPKFLKKYLNIHGLIKDAVNYYCREVETGAFPTVNHSYVSKTKCN
jgi:3-methyl-2-oxobutanoate hydroxymethyltransferase